MGRENSGSDEGAIMTEGKTAHALLQASAGRAKTREVLRIPKADGAVVSTGGKVMTLPVHHQVRAVGRVRHHGGHRLEPPCLAAACPVHLDKLHNTLLLHVGLLPACTHQQRVLAVPRHLIYPVFLIIRHGCDDLCCSIIMKPSHAPCSHTHTRHALGAS